MRRSLINALTGSGGVGRQFDPLESGDDSSSVSNVHATSGTAMGTTSSPAFKLPDPTTNSAPVAMNSNGSTASAGSDYLSPPDSRGASASVSKKNLQHQRHATSIASLHHGANGRDSSVSVSMVGNESQVQFQPRGASSSIIEEEEIEDSQNHQLNVPQPLDGTRQKRAASKSRPRWHSHSISSAFEPNGENHSARYDKAIGQAYPNDDVVRDDAAVSAAAAGVRESVTGTKIDMQLKRNLLINGAAFLRLTEESNPQFVTLRLIPSAGDGTTFSHLVIAPVSRPPLVLNTALTNSRNSSVIHGQSASIAAAASPLPQPVPLPLSNSAGSTSPNGVTNTSPTAGQATSPHISTSRGLLSGALAVAGASLPPAGRGGHGNLPPLNRAFSPVKAYPLASQPRPLATEMAANSNQFSFQSNSPGVPISPGTPTSEILSIPLSAILNIRLGYKSKRFKKTEPHQPLEHASFTLVYHTNNSTQSPSAEEKSSGKKTSGNKGNSSKGKKGFIHLTAAQSANYDVWVAALNVIHDANSSGGKVTLDNILPAELLTGSTLALARYSVSYLPLIYSLYHELQQQLQQSNPPSAATSPSNAPPPLPNRRTSKLYNAKKDELLAGPQTHAMAAGVAPVAYSLVSNINNPPISGNDVLDAAQTAGSNGSATPGRVDVLPFLRRGAYFLKFSKFGKPRFYFYRLSEDNYTLCRYDTELDIADRGPNKCVDIRTFDQILHGQRSKRFKSAPVQLYPVSFSILVLDGGEDISLIAGSTTEYTYWTQGLTALINLARQYQAPLANADGSTDNSNVTLSPQTRGRLSLKAFSNASMHVKEVCIDVNASTVAKNVSTDWKLCSTIDKKSLRRVREINAIALGTAYSAHKSYDEFEDDD